MNKIQQIKQYLFAKKPKSKKQLFIQCAIGLLLGISIGLYQNYPQLKKNCKESLKTIQDDINRQAAFRLFPICGFSSFTGDYCAGKEQVKQEIEQNRDITLGERLCSYLIEK
ncbi:hypothetical protein CQA53_11340 [Helicobacter didelphidarum]|uniref:Uncharacterized protein n=1 Tax=Helicobacter didelphidarum TaxID=2040648 RepID=A0A3D8I3B1_9HELI|nr:hypothetical protein [Helicobacter didelphidarum]RDU59598.1 hypothetical protein CQA53_11340 [Helicobacter didelphidarum]